MTITSLSKSNSNKLQDALVQLGPELKAIPRGELLNPKFDVMEAAGKVAGALPNLLGLRSAIVTRFPGFDIDLLDKLELCLQAVIEAYSPRMTLLSAETVELAAEGIALHDKLLFDAHTLVRLRLVSPKILSELRGTESYEDLGQDLFRLSFLAEWVGEGDNPNVSFTTLDLAKAQHIGLELATNAARERQDAFLAIEDDRRRAFTLFSRVYEQVKQVVSCVRFNERDADAFAPPLVVKAPRQSRKKSKATAPEASCSTEPGDSSTDPMVKSPWFPQGGSGTGLN
ncbi:MAG TPA: hypothetical protein VIV60_04825 [Polyangiaceae bacterium]